MRTVTAPRLAILNGQHPNFYTRVELENPDGAFTDVTSLFTFDFFNSAGWTENIDQPVSQGTIVLAREHVGADGTRYSMSPTVAASPINRNAANAYARFLRAGRKVRVYVAWTADGVAPIAGDWLEVFLGRTDEVDWHGKQNEVTLAVRDAGAWLQDKWIEAEAEYSDDTGVAVETIMQQILDANIEPKLGAVALYTPVSPGWVIKKFTQQKKSVLDALRDLALQIGWDVRFKWDDATGLYRLTFYQPDRAKAVADWTLSADQYYDVTQLKEGDANVRNKIHATATAADGTALESTDEDVASQTEFGVRWMEVAEDATSNIDTQPELDALTAAIKSDLAQPRADQEVENLLFPVAEIGDLGGWLANGKHYDSDQLLAVVQVRHEITREKRRTYIQVRGQVAGAYYEWRRRQGQGGTDGSTDVSKLALKNWRELRRTDTDVTFGFEASAGTARIAVYEWVQAVGETVTWPTADQAPTRWLDPATTEYTMLYPPAGSVRYAQLQPANALLEFGEFVRQRVFAVEAPPEIENEAQQVSISGLYTAVSFDVVDPQSLGGTVRAWVNSGSEDSADSSATPDGTVVVGATPAHISGGTAFTLPGGGTAAILSNIPVHPGRGKRVYFEFTNSLGISSGTIAVNLLSQGGIIDANGDIIDAAIKRASQFAAGIAPVQVLGALPSSAADNTLVFLTTDGQLYRRIGGVWTLEVKAVNLTGQLVTSQIADAAINTAKFAAGIKPVELLSTTTGSPGTNRIAYNTADGKLYRSSPDGTAWVSAIPAVDISGQLIAAQIADAAITTAKFAAGIRPVRIVAALPGAGDVQGDTVFLTTDNKLYRWTGSAWTSTVPTVDLTGTVTTLQIAANAITTALIAANAVTSTEIADNSITTPKLIAGAVTAAKITAGTITSNEIAALTIVAGNIAASTITGGKIAAGTITAANIAADTITAGEIAAGAISTSELAANAVTAAKIAAGTITANEIAANTITGGKIAANTLTASNIAAGTITATELAANSIIAGKIAAGAVSTTELAANAVTAAKIAAGTITATEIAALTITGANIAAGAITAAKITAGTITSTELATNSIIAGKIAAGAINSSSLFVSGVVTATVISVSNLAAISTNLGIIVSGKLNSANGQSYLDLNATGTSPFLHHADSGGSVTIELLANGSATFYGTVASTTFTGSGALFVNGITIGSAGSGTMFVSQILMGSSGLTAPSISVSGGNIVLAGSHSGTTYSGNVMKQVGGIPGNPIGIPGVVIERTGAAPSGGGNYQTCDLWIDKLNSHLYFNDGGVWTLLI